MTSRVYIHEREYRLDKIAERGDTPHEFVPGEKKLGIISCAACTRYRPYFAHDPDLRDYCVTCKQVHPRYCNQGVL